MNEYEEKVTKSQVFVGQGKESHMWLNLNTTSQKTVGIMNMLEQIIETRKWKVMRGIGDTDGKYRLCGLHDETVQHLLA